MILGFLVRPGALQERLPSPWRVDTRIPNSWAEGRPEAEGPNLLVVFNDLLLN